MGISYVENTSVKLTKLVGGLEHNAAAMIQIGNDAVSMIEARTGLGRNETGGSFPPYKERGTYYAPTTRRPAGYPMPSGGRTTHKLTGQPLKTVAYDGGYGAYKAAIGRGIIPQLSVSGEMLGDMVVRGADNWAEIYFASELSKAKAHGHQISGRYQFFGLDYGTIDVLYKEMGRYVAEMLRRLDAA